MIGVRVFLSGILVLLVVFIVVASLRTPLWEEGGELMPFIWFQVTLLDLYAGIALAACWVFYRERSRLLAALWTAGFIMLGNALVLLYVLICFRGVRTIGDLDRFFHGAKATVLRRETTA